MTKAERIEEKIRAWEMLNPTPKAGEKKEVLAYVEQEADMEIEEGIEGQTAEEILQQ